MSLVIASYNNESESGLLLKQELGCKMLHHESKPVPSTVTHVVKYGRFNYRDLSMCKVLNSNVEVAIDKLRTYSRLGLYGVPCLEFTSLYEVARTWLEEGCTLVARTKTTGKDGDGISLLTTVDELEEDNDYKFFTKYKKKKHEYRIHVFQGKVIWAQIRVRKNDVIGSQQIRTGDAWVLKTIPMEQVPEEVVDVSIKALAVLSLDFAGFDIGFNEFYRQAFVIEANTAPTLFSATNSKGETLVGEYAKCISNWVEATTNE